MFEEYQWAQMVHNIIKALPSRRPAKAAHQRGVRGQG